MVLSQKPEIAVLGFYFSKQHFLKFQYPNYTPKLSPQQYLAVRFLNDLPQNVTTNQEPPSTPFRTHRFWSQQGVI